MVYSEKVEKSSTSPPEGTEFYTIAKISDLNDSEINHQVSNPLWLVHVTLEQAT